MDADESKQFSALDAYLDALQQGEDTERERLLKENPQLAGVVECLDALDSLAPLGPPGGDGHFDPSSPVTVDDVVEGPGAAGKQAAAETSDEVPREFGDFELIEEIGRGGMGVVFKARQKSLDRLVALKMILASHLASPDHVRRFEGEARAAAALRHPHVVAIYGAGHVAGQHYFAMQLIEGQSLALWKIREAISTEQAVRWVIQVARAVDHLHQNGIIHRDLKPSNIVLDAEGQPYVTDFGLAKVFDDPNRATRTGVIAGTPSYMSPEQAAARPEEVGPASDVYSLGAILYELLTGQPPFRDENPLDTLLQVLEREPVPPRRLNPRIGGDLEQICLKCLEKSPQQRYRSAAALADDLERYFRGEPVEAAKPGVVRRVVRWALREPALASRLGVFGTFYLVELVNYRLGFVPADFHFWSTVLLGVWIAVSIALQQVLNRERQSPQWQRWANVARFAWGGADVLLLSLLLRIADGVASPLLVGYPLLIVGSGLWGRVRIVWLVTGLSMASYLALVLEFYVLRPDLVRQFDSAYDRPVFFMIMLAVMGTAVAYQVNRIRSLTRYYEEKPVST